MALTHEDAGQPPGQFINNNANEGGALSSTVPGGPSVADLVAQLQARVQHLEAGPVRVARQVVANDKVIMNLKPLTDDRAAFRQWNIKFHNAMKQVDETYGHALDRIMKNVNMGQPADELLEHVSGLHVDRFNADLEFVLAD